MAKQVIITPRPAKGPYSRALKLSNSFLSPGRSETRTQTQGRKSKG